ncbi:TPA: hypothetical protein ACM37D_002362 [Escherichia coli]
MMTNLPYDYFLSADDKLVEFLERQGEECIKEIEQSNTINRENGYKLLGILIVGIGSSFLLLTQNNQPFFMSLGIGVFMLYWAACAIYLVTGVLSVQVRALLNSAPADLYTKLYKSLDHEHYEELASRGFTADRNPVSVIRRIRLPPGWTLAQAARRRSVLSLTRWLFPATPSRWLTYLRLAMRKSRHRGLSVR